MAILLQSWNPACFNQNGKYIYVQLKPSASSDSKMWKKEPGIKVVI